MPASFSRLSRLSPAVRLGRGISAVPTQSMPACATVSVECWIFRPIPLRTVGKDRATRSVSSSVLPRLQPYWAMWSNVHGLHDLAGTTGSAGVRKTASNARTRVDYRPRRVVFTVPCSLHSPVPRVDWSTTPSRDTSSTPVRGSYATTSTRPAIGSFRQFFSAAS